MNISDFLLGVVLLNLLQIHTTVQSQKWLHLVFVNKARLSGKWNYY